jgi:RNA polymerase sigma-70 factor (ECF subfamily)
VRLVASVGDDDEAAAVIGPVPDVPGAGLCPVRDGAPDATTKLQKETDVDLSQVYSEHYRSLVRFLYRRTGDQALAEDLAQEAFVKAIEHQPERPKAWLFQVAANLVRDDFRRRAVRRRHLELVGSERGAVSAGAGSGTPAQPDVALERSETAARVRAALDGLAPNDRDGLLLCEEGLSYDEIAAVLGISKSSVGTTLSRARSRLAAAYEKLETAGSQTDAAH